MKTGSHVGYAIDQGGPWSNGHIKDEFKNDME